MDQSQGSVVINLFHVHLIYTNLNCTRQFFVIKKGLKIILQELFYIFAEELLMRRYHCICVTLSSVVEMYEVVHV